MMGINIIITNGTHLKKGVKLAYPSSSKLVSGKTKNNKPFKIKKAAKAR